MNIGHTIKCMTLGMPALLTGGEPGCRAGNERLAQFRPGLSAAQTISVRSPAFDAGAAVPSKYSVEGDNLSPPLAWSDPPEGAQALALVVEDPDAPTPNPFVHWLLYNIPRELTEIPEGVRHESLAAAARGAMQGKNSNLKVGWAGMAPPPGDTPHHYHFQLFALDRKLDLPPGVGRSALLDAMEGHVIAAGAVVGTFKR